MGQEHSQCCQPHGKSRAFHWIPVVRMYPGSFQIVTMSKRFKKVSCMVFRFFFVNRPSNNFTIPDIDDRIAVPEDAADHRRHPRDVPRVDLIRSGCFQLRRLVRFSWRSCITSVMEFARFFQNPVEGAYTCLQVREATLWRRRIGDSHPGGTPGMGSRA
jgi:hypothetical protein